MQDQENKNIRRLIIGITGASGVQYGVRMLEMLQTNQVETHLVMSQAAELTLALETEMRKKNVEELADVVHSTKDISATIASGSFKTMGMIIAPCSIRSMSEIATGVTSSLLTRAADVTLKERKPLVMMVRETPLHAGHLNSMARLAEMGAIIAPPVPAFYTKPQSVDDIIDQTSARMLDLFDIDVPQLKRWKEAEDQAYDQSRQS